MESIIKWQTGTPKESGKDILTLLLAIYGFTEVKISSYKGHGNTQGYIIDAYNKKT